MSCYISVYEPDCTAFRIAYQSSSLLVTDHLPMSLSMHKYSINGCENKPTTLSTHFYFDVFFECDGALLCMKIIFIIAFGFFLNHCCMCAFKKEVSLCVNSYLNTVQNFQWVHDFTICNIALRNISHLPC